MARLDPDQRFVLGYVVLYAFFGLLRLLSALALIGVRSKQAPA